MIEFHLPSLGADMDEGALVAWHVKPGDEVTRGQVVAEVETDKGIIDVECWDEGVVAELLVEPSPTRLPVGTAIARLATKDEVAKTEPEVEAPDEAAAAAKPEPPAVHVDRAAPAAASPTRPIPTAPAMTPPQRIRERHRHVVRATPRAKRLAMEAGVDLATIAPSRSDGLIVAADLRAVSAAEAPAPQLEVKEEPARDLMREAIGRAMERSKREIPHYYLGMEIDFGPATDWLDELNEDRGIADRVLPAALLLAAVARSIAEVPEVNGHWIDGRFVASEAIHLGVAVSLRGGGLVAPAIHDADRLSVEELMPALRDLVNRARAGRLRSSEMSDATITVTNLGDRGVDETFPVIVPPQVAMVGFGRAAERPFIVDGAVVARPTVKASLAADHRVTDGHRGGLFLARIDALLRQPELL